MDITRPLPFCGQCQVSGVKYIILQTRQRPSWYFLRIVVLSRKVLPLAGYVIVRAVSVHCYLLFVDAVAAMVLKGREEDEIQGPATTQTEGAVTSLSTLDVTSSVLQMCFFFCSLIT